MSLIPQIFTNMDQSCIGPYGPCFIKSSSSPTLSTPVLFLFYLTQKLALINGRVGELLVRVFAFLEEYSALGLKEKNKKVFERKLLELNMSKKSLEYREKDIDISFVEKTESLCFYYNILK
jgi:hypothetical protein